MYTFLQIFFSREIAAHKKKFTNLVLQLIIKATIILYLFCLYTIKQCCSSARKMSLEEVKLFSLVCMYFSIKTQYFFIETDEFVEREWKKKKCTGPINNHSLQKQKSGFWGWNAQISSFFSCVLCHFSSTFFNKQ